ncbi:g785 [Coccomyxa elongata]
MLSDLSNIFGAPGTGIHSVRLGGIAIIDVVLSLVLALCITLATGQNMIKDEVRMKINQYIYLFNRYNVYGLLALFTLSIYWGLFQVPPGSRFGGTLTIAMCVALACVLSVVVKAVLKITCGFTDVCECRTRNKKEYRNPRMYTCPPEDLQSVWRDVQFVIEDFGMNALYRYNLLTPLLFPAFALTLSLITFDPSKLGLYVVTGLLGLFIVTKIVINFFFVVQGFCPCDCDDTDGCPPEYGGTTPLTPAAPSAPTSPSGAQADVVPATSSVTQADSNTSQNQEGTQDTQGGTYSEDAILSDIEKEVQDELKRMHAGADDERLREVCKQVTEKLQSYSNGRPITDQGEIDRINRLRIPPGYHDVQISPDPSSRIQAIGFDDRNRQQTMYHRDFVANQQRKKYEALTHFKPIFEAALFQPCDSASLLGSTIARTTLEQWLLDLRGRVPGTKRGAKIVGAIGSGKSLLARLVLTDAGYQPVVCSASEARTPKIVRERLDRVAHEGNVRRAFGAHEDRPLAIVMDDLDALTTSERSGIAEIVAVVNPVRGKKSLTNADRAIMASHWSIPVICICEERNDRRFAELDRDFLESSRIFFR